MLKQKLIQSYGLHLNQIEITLRVLDTQEDLPCNTRATNEYKNCFNLAYCCNRYISPDYINYFQTHNVNVDENLFALSELLQWIWRSAIREGKSINLYIPSSRMRNLLTNWLNNENI